MLLRKIILLKVQGGWDLRLSLSSLSHFSFSFLSLQLFLFLLVLSFSFFGFYLPVLSFHSSLPFSPSLPFEILNLIV